MIFHVLTCASGPMMKWVGWRRRGGERERPPRSVYKRASHTSTSTTTLFVQRDRNDLLVVESTDTEKKMYT